MKNLIPKIIAFLIGISPIYLMAYPSLVISADLADTKVATSSDTIKDEIKQRIQEVVQDKLKVRKLIGVVGKITDFKLDAITLVNNLDSYHISVASNSAIQKENKPAKISDLAISDRLIIIGYINDSNVIDSRRIIVTKEQPLIEKTLQTITLSKIDKKNSAINTINVPTKLNFDFDKVKVGDKLAIITTISGKTTTLLKYLKLP